MVGRTVGRDYRPVGKQLPGVLEDHDTVAEQAPSLLRVADYRMCRLAVGCRGIRAGRCVRAHVSASWISYQTTVYATWPADRTRGCARPRTPTNWPRPLTTTLPSHAGIGKRLAGTLGNISQMLIRAGQGGGSRARHPACQHGLGEGPAVTGPVSA